MTKRAFYMTLLAASLGVGGVVYWNSDKGGSDDVTPVSGSEAIVDGEVIDKKVLEDEKQDGVAEEKARRRFVGLTDGSVRWQVRVDRLRRLDGEILNDAEVDYLYSLLRFKPSSRDENGWWAVVNEVMAQLCRQGIGRERYTEEMVGIIGDVSAHEVLRDYAIQHLGSWISPRETLLESPYEKDEQKVKQAVEVIAGVVDDVNLRNTSIPGTALKLLAYTREGHEELVDEAMENLGPWMERMITEGGDSGARISVLNVAGLLKLEKHLESVRGVVNDADANGSARLSAIAALGGYGKEEDRERLEAIANSETKFRHAAVAALKRLEP